MTQEINEATLTRLREGDLDALKEVYNVYAGSLYQVAVERLENEILAHNLVADTFIALWSDREAMLSQLNVKAYLYTYVTKRAQKNLKPMKEKFDFFFEIDGDEYSGEVLPSEHKKEDGSPVYYSVHLNQMHFGSMVFENGKWRLQGEPGNPILVQKVTKVLEEKIQS